MKLIKTLKTITAAAVLFSGILVTPEKVMAAKPPRNAQACKVYKVCTKDANVYTFKAINDHLLQDLTYYDAQEKSRKPLQRGAYYDVVFVGDYPKKAVRIRTTAKLNAQYKRIQTQQKRDRKFRYYNGDYSF